MTSLTFSPDPRQWCWPGWLQFSRSREMEVIVRYERGRHKLTDLFGKSLDTAAIWENFGSWQTVAVTLPCMLEDQWGKERLLWWYIDHNWNSSPLSHHMKRLSGVALVIYMAVPGVKHGVFVYHLIWIFFSVVLLFMEIYINIHSQISRFSCIIHQRSSLGGTVVVALTMISDYSAFFTLLQNTACGLLPKTDSVSSDNLSHSPVQPNSFSQSRRDGGVFCALQT